MVYLYSICNIHKFFCNFLRDFVYNLILKISIYPCILNSAETKGFSIEYPYNNK